MIAPTPPTISLFPSYRADSTVAWWRGRAVSHPQFIGSVLQLGERLPSRRFAMVLCADRFHFLTAFAAVIGRGQTNLLPASKMAGEIDRVAKIYPDSYCIVEKELPELAAEQFVLDVSEKEAPAAASIPRIPREHVAAIVFTSGSTGDPGSNSKTWGSLVIGAELWKNAFWGERPGQPAIVATVPPQHMYGLETTIMLGLAAGVSIHGGQPFLPANIRDALESLPAPRVLISTPIHLKACVETSQKWPELDFIVSATAPLPPSLAARVERAFGTRVMEIYGSTEAGALASRRTLDGDLWRVYDGVKLRLEDGAVLASGGHLSAPVPLQDHIELELETTFRLIGRNSDMIDVAGKRASLADLNGKLRAIEGVEDGVFIAPGEGGGGDGKGAGRLAALVIAPGLSEEEIFSQLRQRIEPAFLPRPLYRVASLPYNDLGKLPRKELLARVKSGKTDRQ